MTSQLKTDDKGKQGCGHRVRKLGPLILIGIAYVILIHFEFTFTGIDGVDGSISVVFGLYICSHPAANFVSLIYSFRSGRCQFSSKGSAGFWLLLNLFALLVGWMVIFVGTTQLIGRTS